MAKNRKTRKDKLRAAKRLTSLPSSQVSSSTPQPESVFTFSADTAPSPTQRTITSQPVYHLREDLLRTGVVTGAIILAEVILFFTLTMR